MPPAKRCDRAPKEGSVCVEQKQMWVLYCPAHLPWEPHILEIPNRNRRYKSNLIFCTWCVWWDGMEQNLEHGKNSRYKRETPWKAGRSRHVILVAQTDCESGPKQTSFFGVAPPALYGCLLSSRLPSPCFWSLRAFSVWLCLKVP